ncbi:MAG: hypothetical protein QXI19_13320, partial [Candidatus Caldarchaeum sp.]
WTGTFAGMHILLSVIPSIVDSERDFPSGVPVFIIWIPFVLISPYCLLLGWPPSLIHWVVYKLVDMVYVIGWTMLSFVLCDWYAYFLYKRGFLNRRYLDNMTKLEKEYGLKGLFHPITFVRLFLYELYLFGIIKEKNNSITSISGGVVGLWKGCQEMDPYWNRMGSWRSALKRLPLGRDSSRCL